MKSINDDSDSEDLDCYHAWVVDDVGDYFSNVEHDDYMLYPYTMNEIETIVKFEVNTIAHFLKIIDYDMYKNALDKYSEYDKFCIHAQSLFQYCEKPDIHTIIIYWSTCKKIHSYLFSEIMIHEIINDINVLTLIDENMIEKFKFKFDSCSHEYFIISMITTTRVTDDHKINLLLKHILKNNMMDEIDYRALVNVLEKYLSVDEIVEYMSMHKENIPVLYRYIKDHPEHTYVLENFSKGVFTSGCILPESVIGKKHIIYDENNVGDKNSLSKYDILWITSFIDNNPSRVYVDDIEKLMKMDCHYIKLDHVCFNKNLMIKYLNETIKVPYTKKRRKFKLTNYALNLILHKKSFRRALDKELLLVILSKRVTKKTYKRFESIINNIP
jgi:hypothetical protein